MKWPEVKKDWTVYRSQFKTKWPKLTDADLDKIRGDRDTLIKLLKEKHGLEKVDAERAIDTFLNTLKKPAATA